MADNIYFPERAVNNTLLMIDERMNQPHAGVVSNLPETSGLIVPWRIGDLIVVCGYTSNGKTSLMNYITSQHAYGIRSHKQEHPDYNHVIVYVTWEQAIEEQTAIDLSRVTSIPASKMFQGSLTKAELEKIKGEGATMRKELPIWLVGHSIMDDRRRPRMSMQDVNTWLSKIEGEYNMVIDMIVLDYLQRVKRTVGTGESAMREGFMDIVDQAKDMALRCPVVLISQAKREVTSREIALPELDDGQETSNLEQSSDHYISVWMPKQKYKIGRKLTWGNMQYEVTDHLIMVGFLKQKMGSAPIYRFYNMGYGGTSLEAAQGVEMPKEEKKK